ncbi:winged helix-turn-helix domain-containing protein [Catellatospora citrea]|uniref:HTH gntR-type domain-containing protein n=1 Tax=Catellatospora citrea TaxID=53366 RepID=A0A8J3P2U4_9ACTN|nr:hypothetical protein Cci01nite_66400 [Catellatospora citrea]
MTAKYERLANAIREKIRSGELKPGDKLPSISQIREEYQISYGSVRGAMLVLKAEGPDRGTPRGRSLRQGPQPQGLTPSAACTPAPPRWCGRDGVCAARRSLGPAPRSTATHAVDPGLERARAGLPDGRPALVQLVRPKGLEPLTF